MGDNKINLGDLAKDKITSFRGIVIAKTDWLNGCTRITIQPQELKDGKAIEADTFDIQQVVVLEAGMHSPAPPRGGPMPKQKRSSDPGR